MDWEPSRADHSIDRATISFTLATTLDANTFDELVLAGRKVGAIHHLNDRIDLFEAPELPQQVQDGMMLQIPAVPPRRVVFRRLDGGGLAVDELSISMQRIAIGTLRYSRWADLFLLVSSSLQALDSIYPITSHIKIARLEFVDSFQSVVGGADHFQVIDRDSDYVANTVRNKSAALHVHSGWFDFETPNIRRLTNVNIEVIDIPVPPPPDPRRKISILTVGQDEALQGTALDRPAERVDWLHGYLKSIFQNTITVEAAARVGLTSS